MDLLVLHLTGQEFQLTWQSPNGERQEFLWTGTPDSVKDWLFRVASEDDIHRAAQSLPELYAKVAEAMDADEESELNYARALWMYDFRRKYSPFSNFPLAPDLMIDRDCGWIFWQNQWHTLSILGKETLKQWKLALE